MKKSYAYLSILAALCGCSSRTALQDGDALAGDLLADGAVNAGMQDLFVGTWTCTDTARVVINDEPNGWPPPWHFVDLMTFVANADGTLTMTGETVEDDGVSGDFGTSCSCFTFRVSGSYATLIHSPPLALNDAVATQTFTGGIFAVTGSTATIDLYSRSRGPEVDSTTNSLTGTCTKDPDDSGAASPDGS